MSAATTILLLVALINLYTSGLYFKSSEYGIPRLSDQANDCDDVQAALHQVQTSPGSLP
ncbi:protein of unknown function [Aminobacter niigataensis]|nr:protein of unknown function [Aminobacter niigataensis]